MDLIKQVLIITLLLLISIHAKSQTVYSPKAVTDGSLTIELPQYNSNTTIQIIDILGTVVKRAVTNSNTLTLDVSDLSRGVYFVSIKSKNVSSNSKIIIK